MELLGNHLGFSKVGKQLGGHNQLSLFSDNRQLLATTVVRKRPQLLDEATDILRPFGQVVVIGKNCVTPTSCELQKNFQKIYQLRVTSSTQTTPMTTSWVTVKFQTTSCHSQQHAIYVTNDQTMVILRSFRILC